ncbi:MAG: 8-oxo-dGTP diphosphatase [Gemmatimonadota bacterium]|nr:8-oxo-dGTP diphosphatase [Gemmatimonadota bacterium]
MSEAFEAIDWDRWTGDLEATLLYVVREGRMLLIEKKRGLGAGKLNGPGGKVDPGETVVEAAIREFEEELGATPLDPVRIGRVAFAVTDGDDIMIHVFRATRLEGEPVETDEAVPVWADVDDLPYDRMWDDDRYWLPLLVENRTFLVRTLFEGDRLLGFEVEHDAEI